MTVISKLGQIFVPLILFVAGFLIISRTLLSPKAPPPPPQPAAPVVGASPTRQEISLSAEVKQYINSKVSPNSGNADVASLLARVNELSAQIAGLQAIATRQQQVREEGLKMRQRAAENLRDRPRRLAEARRRERALLEANVFRQCIRTRPGGAPQTPEAPK